MSAKVQLNTETQQHIRTFTAEGWVDGIQVYAREVKDWSAALADFGRKGWELVCTSWANGGPTMTSSFFFKRPLAHESAAT